MTQEMAASLGPDVELHRNVVLGCLMRNIGQFADIGIQQPGRIATHRVADNLLAAHKRTSRTLYMDTAALDATPLGMLGITNSRLLVQGTPFDAPQVITSSGLFDLHYPIAVFLFGVLEFYENPGTCIGLLQDLLSVLPPQSVLVATHAGPGITAHVPQWHTVNTGLTPRPPGMFEGIVTRAGFSLLAPGIVAPQQWTPDAPSRLRAPDNASLYLAWAWVPPDAA